MPTSSTREKEIWLQALLKDSPDSLDVEAFLVVLRALADSDEADAPRRADRWMIELEKLSETVEQLEPNTTCYQLVVQTWANAQEEDPRIAIPRAERWLDPKASCGVDIGAFNAFLDLCTKGRYFKKAKGLVYANAAKAESVLEFMIEQRQLRGPLCSISPNTESFNFVIRGWTRCRDSNDIVERTVKIIQQFSHYERDIDPTVRPNAKSYTMLLDAFNALAKTKVKICRDPSDPTRNGIEELERMQHIIDSMKASPKSGMYPETHTYNVLLTAWGNMAALHDSAPYEAEELLRKMIQFKKDGKPDMGANMVSYQHVVRAWCLSKHARRIDRAIWWLENLWRDAELYNDKSLIPDNKIYNTLIKACVESGDARKADGLLEDMIARTGKASHFLLKPNSESFIWVTRGYTEAAKSGNIGALNSAVEKLDRMIQYEKDFDQNIAVPARLYEEVLKGCSRCAVAYPNALDMAVDVFEKLRASHHNMTCLAYQRLLQTGLMALSRPQDDETREAFVRELIHECAEAGLVGSPVIRALSNGPVRYSGYTIEDSRRLTEECFPEWPLPIS